MSLSDGGVQATMPVAPTGMINSGFGGFGGDGAWWIIILFLFVFCGWGGNGWGNNAGNSGGVVDGYVLTSDFANVERKIDSVNQGLCDGFYQQAQLVNGTNMAMANGFAQAELSRSNQQAALMQQLNAMQMQAANCCCENRAAIAQVRYDMATQACDTRNTVQNATQPEQPRHPRLPDAKQAVRPPDRESESEAGGISGRAEQLSDLAAASVPFACLHYL